MIVARLQRAIVLFARFLAILALAIMFVIFDDFGKNHRVSKQFHKRRNCMSAITTHILDISTGFPARGVSVTLEQETSEGWKIIGEGQTDNDGRVRDLLASDSDLQIGKYRLTFDTGNYFSNQQREGFYPQVTVAFIVRNTAQHYHVPLLLSPFGYSTYRGS